MPTPQKEKHVCNFFFWIWPENFDVSRKIVPWRETDSSFLEKYGFFKQALENPIKQPFKKAALLKDRKEGEQTDQTDGFIHPPLPFRPH